MEVNKCLSQMIIPVRGKKSNDTCEKGEKVTQIDQNKAFSWSVDNRKDKCICKEAAQNEV
jgi:hypothetical protein